MLIKSFYISIGLRNELEQCITYHGNPHLRLIMNKNFSQCYETKFNDLNNKFGRLILSKHYAILSMTHPHD